MQRTVLAPELAVGDAVFGAEGDKVGKILALQPGYLVVEKGFFFPTDYYIPLAAVARSGDGEVYLNVSKEQALNQGWDRRP
jgi:hypothetical protein